MWVLVILFVHHGLLIDRPHLYIDGQYNSYAECKHGADKFRAAFRDYDSAICYNALPPVAPKK
jgi:hypothetical protein